MIPRKYDDIIKYAVESYMPTVDWRLFKAQLYQESLLVPDAVSHAGAKGIAQFMDPTWAEVSRDMNLPANTSPFKPMVAIPAAAFYMNKMRNGWTADRQEADRHSLALASYNAGFGNLLSAQSEAGGANDYATIVHSLHLVTGRHAYETKTYVRRIWRYWVNMITANDA